MTQRAVNLASAQLTGKAAWDSRVHLEFAPPADDIVLSADAAQIEDAVLNLIINAIEAIAGDGQVGVSIRLAENSADEDSPEEAVIEVSDNGRGIDEADLARIFNPFFTKTEGGTGLGLPAVRRIARLHGGRIEVQSTPGEGSTFTLHLPLKAASSIAELNQGILQKSRLAEQVWGGVRPVV